MFGNMNSLPGSEMATLHNCSPLKFRSNTKTQCDILSFRAPSAFLNSLIFLIWIPSKYYLLFELKLEQGGTNCSRERPNQPNMTHRFPNTNIAINLLQTLTRDTWRPFAQTLHGARANFVFIFFLVALETLYSWGGRRLTCTLEMEILSLSFTIENANTFRSRMSLKHSEIWINHQTVFALSCCLVMLFQLFKGNGGWAISATNASRQHWHIAEHH